MKNLHAGNLPPAATDEPDSRRFERHLKAGREHAPFWLLTLALGAALTVPTLVSRGTFLDGEIYACLSRNAAAGLGSFWAPHFSTTVQSQWFEHPPLGIALGSLPFRLFGDRPWIEHLWSALVLLAGGAVIVAGWRRMFRPEPAIAALGWLPLLMWLLNPQVSWAHANNMLETTMSLFTFAAAALTTAGMVCGGRAHWLAYVAAPVAIVMAVLVKDVVGLFPLAAAPALAVAGVISWRRAAGILAVQVLAVSALIGLLLLWPAARANLVGFVQTQLVESLAGRRGETANQFTFLVKLFNSLLPSLILAGLLLPWHRVRGKAKGALLGPYARWSFGFMVFGLAGSVPLVLSERQSQFYVLPSFPFLALGLAVLVAPATAERLASRRAGPRLLAGATAGAAMVLVAVLVWSAGRIGNVNRDPELYADIDLVISHLAGTSPVVELAPGLWTNWGLETGLARRGRIAASRGDSMAIWLIDSAESTNPKDVGWERVPLPTQVIELYRRSPD